MCMSGKTADAVLSRDYITSVLRAVGGNRAQAAAKLGIGPATLYRKLKEYGAAAEWKMVNGRW